MFKNFFVFFAFLVLVASNTVFSQTVEIDTAIANAVKEISESVPQGTKIAIINIASDSNNLSDYIINELIVNLVNNKLFQIVPRSTVELEAANKEFGFQMAGIVSDESQKRLGQFLGAGTIITGSVTRDTSNSYRLMVNAIDLESFTYQSSYRISFQNSRQVQTLVGNSGGAFYEDYTTGERIGIGTLNIFFGVGSITQGQKLGWVGTCIETLGIVSLIIGYGDTPYLNDYFDMDKSDWRYDHVQRKKAFVTIGYIFTGGAIVFGYIIPFFHHKPNTTNVSQNNLPFNFELVSSNNQEINGFRILYTIKF